MIDVVFGGSGQDGRIITKHLLRNNRYVLNISRSDPIINHPNLKNTKADLCGIKNILNILDNYIVTNVFYFAAAHSSEKNFATLDSSNSKIINYTAPIEIYQYLKKKRNIKHFIYASSKLVFEKNDNSYFSDGNRRTDNEYSLWKNNFEIALDALHDKSIASTLLWLSNHDSIFRQNNFLLPRLASQIVTTLKSGNDKKFENFTFKNDWGCANEFMRILVEYILDTNLHDKRKVYKQFLSNNDVICPNELIELCICNYKENKKIESKSKNRNEIFYNNNHLINTKLNMPRISSMGILSKLIRYKLMLNLNYK